MTNMLLGFLLLLLISETSEKELEYKYSLSVNPLAFFIVGAGHAGGIILPNPGINFEGKGGGNWSLNFEINVIFPFPIPTEIEVGIREYLNKKKEFRGFYFYQGIAWGWINLLFLPEERYRKIARYIPNLILLGGYKYVFRSGFTIDPFLGLRAAYGFFGDVNLGPFGIWRDLGVYLGYTW